MLSLKEYYQQRRDLLKRNKGLQPQMHEGLNQSFFEHEKNQTRLKKPFEYRGIIYVHASLTNTIVVLTDLKGKTKYVRSAGLCGFQGKKKRSTKFAIISTLEAITDIARDQRFSGLFLCLRGVSRARRHVFKCMKKRGLKLLGIWDFTPNPHNGCRPRKRRRG